VPNNPARGCANKKEKRKVKTFWKMSLVLLATIIGLVAFGFMTPLQGFVSIVCVQALAFVMAKPSEALLNGVLTPEQVKEFERILNGFKDYGTLFKDLADLGTVEGGFAAIKRLPEMLKSKNTEIEQLSDQIKEVKRMLAARQARSANRIKGRLSDEAAAELGAHFTLLAYKKGMLDTIVPNAELRSSLVKETRSILNIAAEKDLSTSDIPLPTTYYGEIRDLIEEYGIVRGVMTPWPLSGGTDAPPRGKTRFGLTKTAMGAQLGEKTAQIEFASLESHKFGGIIYTPRELREQSIVALGQYLARLGAIAASQIEDEVGFLADGTATYDSIKGVTKIAADNSKVRQLAAAKTSPSDVTIVDFRAMLGLVNSRVLSTGIWYMHATWMPYLPELNTEANQYNYRQVGDQHFLLGRPIKWTEVLQPYSDAAAAAKFIAVFGDLSYWWFATRAGGLRIDESSDFKFDYDLISTRMIEEFDFDYMSAEAAAAMKTGAGA
jgi:HK97 family phage major capsid protein